jgi:ABC-type glutathione transport system ATPase component
VIDNTLINVENLSIGFEHNDKVVNVVNDLSFQINEGEIIGIVGESGSGKTMTALCLMGLLPKDAIVVSGRVLFDMKDLLKLDKEKLRLLKGKAMSMIFQEPMTSLNPSMTVGYQVEEMLILHEPDLSKAQRKEKTLNALREAGLQSDREIYNQYPHQLSGGMRQRVMIAMAMVCRPKLLIADEPTTALDVTIQGKILTLIQELNHNYGTSVVLISHDLSVIKRICSRVIVMQDGNLIESGSAGEIFSKPAHPYTKQLIAAMPIINLVKKQEKEIFERENTERVLEVNHINAYYKERKGVFSKETKKHVVKDVSLFVNKGETLGVVGESGSGKSTLAKAIVGLLEDVSGEISLNKVKPQMVFQDPYSSLNPTKKVAWILEEPLKLQGKLNKKERKKRVLEVLKEVGLDEVYGSRYLSQLSGGQRQRIAIGVALIQNSKFIVLDEPVSALDVTVQFQILNLLKKLRKEYNLSYLFISHDLNVVYQMCDRVCVMYEGKIVETATIDELFYHPNHEYSKKLLKSVL